MKTLGLVLLLALVAGAFCGYYPFYDPYYYPAYSYDDLLQHANIHGYKYVPYIGSYGYRFYYPEFYPSRYYFYGAYPGKCGVDGLYYNDDRSFVICSNGVGYVQPCAPGSRNPPLGKFAYGNLYGYGDFCAVNVNDQGITN